MQKISISIKFLILFSLILPSSIFATTFTVTNNNASGAGSLDQAIDDANNNPGTDNIIFNIAGSSVAARTITLTSDLPDIDEAVIIDGTTQSNGSAFGISSAKIIVDGGNIWDVFYVDAPNVEIYGIYVKNSDISLIIRPYRSNCIIGSSKKGNVISGSQEKGIYIYDNCDDIIIRNNFIGVDTTGTVLESNQDHGIYISGNGSDDIIIDNNIISGNSEGIRSYGGALSITNNKIGVDISGTNIIANRGYGIRLDLDNPSDLATINNNIISGNDNSGIYSYRGSLLLNNNKIGTNTAETAIIGNDGSGIYISNSESINITNCNISNNSSYGIYQTLLYTSSLATFDNNIISNNGNTGIVSTKGTVSLDNNKIGTDAGEIAIIGNRHGGVNIKSAESVSITNSNISNNTGYHGLYLELISTSDLATINNNIISNNENTGIYYKKGSLASDNNKIGTDATETAIIGNGESGLRVISAESISITNSNISNNTEYGTLLKLYSASDLATINNNIISNNGNTGIYFENGSLTADNNKIGTDAGETELIGNGGAGIYHKASNSSSATLSITNSNISNNTDYGIYIYAQNNTTIKGNYIGTNSSISYNMGNGKDGIYNGGSYTIIGGTGAGERNIIAYNNQVGVKLAWSSHSNSIIANIIHDNGEEGVDIVSNGDYNLISQNSMYCNAMSNGGTPKGIDIQTGNENINPPVMTTLTSTEVSGTSTTPNGTVELFESDNCGLCMGRNYLATTTADASGDWSFSGTFDPNIYYVLTITNSNNSTSEFNTGSGCDISLPIELVEIKGKSTIAGNKIDWTTSVEINNSFFTILKSSDTKNWEEVKQIKGAGNSSSKIEYSIIDDNITSKRTYYQLVQTDFDGKSTTSKTINIENTTISKQIISAPYPNPTNENFSFTILKDIDEVELEMYSELGILVQTKKFNYLQKNTKKIISVNDLNTGVYYVKIKTGSIISNFKLIIN